MPDVHVPGIGNVPRGGLIAGVIVGIGGGLYLYIKHKEKASASTTATSGAYGYGYGSSYGYGGYGYNNPAFNEPYIGGEYGYGGLYGYGIGEGYGVGSPYPPSAPTQVATSNAAWAQAAENYLTTTGGYDPGTVAAALGIYIAGSTLSAAQQSVVEAAIAFEGYPPTAGPDNYPPNMKTSPATGQSGTGTGTTGTGGSGSTGTTTATVRIPSVSGQSATNALNAVRKAGFSASTKPFRNPLNTYVATGTSPSGSAKKGSHVTVNVSIQKKGK